MDQQEQQILEQIKSTVEGNKMVIFMKGEKDFPMCGFSNAAVGVLKSYGKPFVAVNVLPDPRIRKVLCEYSSWPTTPQVFIDGKLVGGCDITLEMHQSGELEQLVKAAFEEA
jgi:monothiol glutaredoxin